VPLSVHGSLRGRVRSLVRRGSQAEQDPRLRRQGERARGAVRSDATVGVLQTLQETLLSMRDSVFDFISSQVTIVDDPTAGE
jgi:hypothetical protein